MRKFQCLKCGDEFYSKKFDKNRTPKFCSKKCYYSKEVSKESRDKMAAAKIGKTAWNKGINIWIGKEHPRGMLGKKGPNKGKILSKESRIKMRNAHLGIKLPERSGANHPQWKGGITSENEKIRKSSDYSNWRRKVFERDYFSCVLCKKKGGLLNADHIKPFSTHPELRLVLDNGRTLCRECHLKTDTYGVKKSTIKIKDS